LQCISAPSEDRKTTGYEDDDEDEDDDDDDDEDGANCKTAYWDTSLWRGMRMAGKEGCFVNTEQS